MSPKTLPQLEPGTPFAFCLGIKGIHGHLFKGTRGSEYKTVGI